MSLGVGRVGGSGLVADQAPLMPAAPATGQGCRETLPFPHPSTTAAGRVPGTVPCACLLGPSVPLTPGDTPVRKREESLFDDEDDLMAALGFGDSPRAERRPPGDQ